MKRIFAYIEQHPFPCFLVITFLISWTLWSAAGTFSPLPPESSVLGFRWAVSQIGVFAPAFAGWIVLSLSDQGSSAWRWNTIWVFFLPMFVLAGVLSVFTYEDLYRNIPLINLID